MKRYLYIIDCNGREIPGSRRSLDHCLCDQEIQAIKEDMLRRTRHGCSINDSGNIPPPSI